MKAKLFCVLLLLAISILSISCSILQTATPTLTFTPTPQPTATHVLPTPTSLAEVENEIVKFMLASFRENVIAADSFYKEQYPTGYFPANWLIIWEKTKPSPDYIGGNPDYFSYLLLNQPIKVWTLTSDQLTEVEDRVAVLKEYDRQQSAIMKMEESHQNGNPDERKSWWSEYVEFGIVSISSDGQNAMVIVDALCGSLCGNLYLDTLQRNISGEWKVIKQETVGYH
jgi:hypothetical protein